MSKAMTIAEIQREFDQEWVLVGDPLLDEALQVQAGTVLFHSLDRDAVYRQTIKLRPKKFAMLRIGKLPKDAAIAL